MKDRNQIDMSRMEELENKELLTKEEFKELGHYRMSQMIHSQAACLKI